MNIKFIIMGVLKKCQMLGVTMRATGVCTLVHEDRERGATTLMVLFQHAIMIIFFVSANLSVIAASVNYQKQHVIILYPGVDKVWGSYMFLVENTSTNDQRVQFSLILPKEISDFQAQEGLSPQDLVIDDQGLAVDKSIAANSSDLFTIGFLVNNLSKSAELTFDVPYEITEFSVLAPQGELVIESTAMQEAQGLNLSGNYFNALKAKDLKAAQKIKVVVKNIPEGRNRFYALGSVLALLLMMAATVFAIKTRPKVRQEQDQQLLV